MLTVSLRLRKSFFFTILGCVALLIGESAIKRKEHFAAFHFFCLLCAMSELGERREADKLRVKPMWKTTSS